jgi:hypothetical protein
MELFFLNRVQLSYDAKVVLSGTTQEKVWQHIFVMEYAWFRKKI